MSSVRRLSQRDRRGFTMIELIVSFVIGLIVLGSVVQMMIAQSRGYRKQREMVDVRETAREAAALLSWDLRQAAVAGSPFVVMGANTVTVRSPRGLGTICAKHALLARYGLWKTAGNILATVDDTALVYQIGRGGVVVEFAVHTGTDTSYIKVGAPFRNFRRVEYAEYQQNSRWWLGRKVGAAASYEKLTGPLLAPASNGLAFAYYDTLGAVTINPAAVGSVAFTLRTESYKNATVGTSFVYQHDSVTTQVAVRR